MGENGYEHFSQFLLFYQNIYEKHFPEKMDSLEPISHISSRDFGVYEPIGSASLSEVQRHIFQKFPKYNYYYRLKILKY